MKRRTLASLAAVFFLLLTGVVLGFVSVAESDGTLTALWVSDTSRETNGNHHAPTATTLDGGPLVVAAVNAPRNAGPCELVAFTPGEARGWTATLPRSACNIHGFGDPTIADLDGDGRRTVFVATTEKLLHAYDLRTGDEAFSRELSGLGYAAPVAADFTPDPGRELVVADLNGGVFVFETDGTPVWNRTLSTVVAPVFVRDVDANGAPELVVGEGGNVTLLDATGAVTQRTAVGGSVTWLTVGQGDDDPALELVAATSGGRVVAVDGRTGDAEWTNRYNTMAAVHAFGDSDGDGRAEVYAVAQDAKLRAIDARDGDVEWTTTLTTADVQMMPPPSLGDLDGDGTPELVAVTRDGVVSIVDPESGAVVDSYERDVPIWTRPTLAELDGDAGREVLVVYGDGRVVALSFDGK